ncbi:hypothetical protein HMPREF9714_00783 [Myroides odoratimimus CCUG 12901]|uniref:Uncharacterized protein n=1 Tax=Myroides odoratimimus TaxID=76832 RepID=A0AAI8C510_9FLAO|nr:hypothetical protein [Myroides odoratimimus]AJA69033.1 hypothetical protein MYRA21_1891 [Myroides sp. A21]ALU26273.1 hypothetical protein AS202_08980 [Myroides odoratimimus]EHO13519.1 hypothetical protein HMPREF9714_00783 [Myroides odoratimimus CCUG 12901]QBK76396.1 hypothetical protein E0Z07_08650 [Myroides odoratimimus]
MFKNKFQQKSLVQRFLFVFGLCFFLLYLGLGCMFLFWDNMPIALEYTHRMLFGGLLIVYGVFRFIRLWNQE